MSNSSKVKHAEINYVEFGKLLDEIESFVDISIHDVYLLSLGSHNKAFFDKLREDQDLNIEWDDSVLPMGWKWLRFLIASHGGLVKVLNKEKIHPTFIPMTELAMSDLLIVEKGTADNLAKRLEHEGSNFNFDVILQSGKAMLFRIDSDTFEEKMPAFLHYSDTFATPITEFWENEFNSRDI